MKDNIVEAIIEIPLNTKNKFEVNKETGKIKLDRVLYSAMTYPVEYGYIENTLAKDGDPLDIVLISSAKTFPGCVVDARIIGYLEVIDNGHEDYKLISVVNVDPRYNEIHSLTDISTFILDEIKDFFANYKTLQNIKVEVLEYHDTNEALNIIKECRERYVRNNKINNLKIKNIKFHISNNEESKIIASCNVTFNNDFILNDIKIIKRDDNLFIAFKQNDFFEDMTPNKDFLNYLENTIIEKYKEINNL